jgi:hypothetical protein
VHELSEFDVLPELDPLLESDPLADSEPLIDESSGVMSLVEDIELDDVAAIVMGRMPGVWDDVAFIDAGTTTVGVVGAAGAVGAWALVGWAAVEIVVPTPPPPPTTGLSADPFEGRAGGTFAEAIVIGLAYRLRSTLAAVEAWGTLGIAIVEVVATTDPEPPPTAWLTAFGATLGEATSDDGIGANLVG